MMKITLNFPVISLKTKVNEKGIFIWDISRKKWIIQTPEEIVRQSLIHTLVDYFDTPIGLIALEKTLKFGLKKRRFDLLVYGKDAKPKMLVECKAPNIDVNQETIYQIAHYNSLLNVKYLLVTNGIKHFMLFINPETNQLDLLDNIPSFNDFSL